ncbi:response regulator [Duganella sp. BJB488]|uniref:Response regulator n=1 Tax=Duganella vulcania TaxID=2692166 RepID=A0A845GFM4_9BURK|nr:MULTISPECIES: response regulator [Duganella]MYM91569.1 response regulator [Duganella vulcania]NVD72988.1 response regulator [Duganella sp. BJB1802]RFP25825.1 response regulator [Duganella sp. BJB489]RFP28435.1 response regulator [Duganella sp. BJB488]RFP36756.1 response regulator [Duganella sp. BJB480]
MTPTKTVLIVDDSRVSRLMARQYIGALHADWIVEEAATGEEALVKARAVGPDLVLMDVNMPGMGGIAAAEQLRQELPAIPISLLTANVQAATRERATLLGIGFMEKPITEARIAQLLSTLEAA